MAKAAHLVVDSGGFLKNANMRSMGETIYSVKEVVSEIRDKATRQRLAFLPYEINLKKPTPESVKKVIAVSKQTGDYPSLSAVDIQVLSLTYELTKQYDHESLPKEFTPAQSKFQFGADRKSGEDIPPGFYMPAKTKPIKGERNDQGYRADGSKHESAEEDQPTAGLSENEDGNAEGNLECGDGNEEIVEAPQEPEDICMVEIKDAVEETVDSGMDEHTYAEDGSQDEEDDENGWITPGNIKRLQQESGQTKEVKVACITTDFAMQNVLMKMGLKIFSVDGMQIRSVRSYVLRCHACFNITKIMTKAFCPKCGNNTLKRVPTSVQPDGSVKYYLSRNPKVLSKRGKKVSLPMPKGGKHAYNPILCEDQPIPQNRMSRKAMQKTNVWSDDYAIDGNPFAVNETESRSFRLGIRHNNSGNGRRRNPNAVGKKFVKKR